MLEPAIETSNDIGFCTIYLLSMRLVCCTICCNLLSILNAEELPHVDSPAKAPQASGFTGFVTTTLAVSALDLYNALLSHTSRAQSTQKSFSVTCFQNSGSVTLSSLNLLLNAIASGFFALAKGSWASEIVGLFVFAMATEKSLCLLILFLPSTRELTGKSSRS